MINPDKLAGPAAADKAGANADICSSCHQPLTRRGPNGECLRCMIGFALSQDENQQSEGRKASTSGSLRYGHFEVVVGVDGLPVELGSGAMAVTYRAHDTVLNCDVALKVIDCPKVDGLIEDDNTVVVLAGLTVWLKSADVLAL